MVRVTYTSILFQKHSNLYAARMIVLCAIAYTAIKKKKKPLGKACAEHTQNMQDGKRPNVIKAYMKPDIPICRALAAFL